MAVSSPKASRPWLGGRLRNNMQFGNVIAGRVHIIFPEGVWACRADVHHRPAADANEAFLSATHRIIAPVAVRSKADRVLALESDGLNGLADRTYGRTRLQIVGCRHHAKYSIGFMPVFGPGRPAGYFFWIVSEFKFQQWLVVRGTI